MVKRMKKILVIVPNMDVGGVTTSAINFCNELAKRGNNVHFLNMGKEIFSAEKGLDNTIKKIRLIGKEKKWNLNAREIKRESLKKKIKLFPIAVIKKLTNQSERWLNIIFYRYCIAEEYDIAVAFKQCAPCYYFTLNCTRAKKKIAFIHGDLNYMGDISSWDVYFDKFDAIACVSDAVRSGFQNKYAKFTEKFVTIYNMFDRKEIVNKAKIKVQNIHIDSNICNIVTVARIENETKRIDIIPEICEALKKCVDNPFHWYVIGDGPDLEINRQKSFLLGTDDVLTFYGSMDNPFFVMQQMDFSVLPSKTEAYSMVVMESLILGKPVVLSRYPGAEEAVEDGKTGLIANQSMEDLTEKITQLISDQSLRNNLKLNVKNAVINNDKAYLQFEKITV